MDTPHHTIRLTHARFVDSVCVRFEEAWQADAPRPVIEEFLGDTPDPPRANLVLELIRLDLFYRQRAGDAPTLEDYATRFPVVSRDWLQQALANSTVDPSPHSTAHPSAPKQPPGPDLAGYDVLEELGRGAMGVVYKARDLKLNRTVALKMILSGDYASPAERDRFRIEAEAVARLAHPNIVTIYEVGETASSPPAVYCSLEYLDGGTLADRLARTPQPPREAAGCVEQLALAVQHAHERGVVHRDLKPGNVLLQLDRTTKHTNHTREDPEEGNDDHSSSSFRVVRVFRGSLLPKITDFGLAKRLDVDDGQTRSGAIVGTPSYMAPEQAEGRTKDVGPLVDVYALGAILYEMMVGSPPFRGESVAATLELVRSREPVAPSTLQPTVPRDLETICLKCLQKEPGKRYATAAALADDLRRFLEGRPILARPVGALERTWRWSKRNPALASLVSLGVAALVGLAVGLAVVSRARNDTAKALEQAEAALAAESAALAQTEDALATLTDDAVERTLGRQVKLSQEDREFFLKVVGLYDRLAAATGDTPDGRLRRAEGLQRIAQLRFRLGDPPAAEEQFRQALKLREDHRADAPADAKNLERLAACYAEFSNLLHNTGRTKDAVAALNSSLGISRPLLADAPAHVPTRKLVALALSSLARLHEDADELKQAEACLDEAIRLRQELADEFPATPEYRLALSTSQQLLSEIYALTDRRKEAERLARAALAAQDNVLAANPTNPRVRRQVAVSRNGLARLLTRAGDAKEAERLEREAIEIVAALAAEFPAVPEYRSLLAVARSNFAIRLEEEGRAKEAVEMTLEAVALWRKLAADFPKSTEYRRNQANLLNLLANLYHAPLGRNDDSEKAYREALALLEAVVKEEPKVSFHKKTLGTCLNNLGALMNNVGRYADAEPYYRRAIEVQTELNALNPKDLRYQFDLGRSYVSLANVLLAIKRPTEAEPLYRQALAIREHLVAVVPKNHDHKADLAQTLGRYAGLLRQRKEYAEARKLLARAEPLLALALGVLPDNNFYRKVRRFNTHLLAQLDADEGKHAAAAKGVEALARVKVEPADDVDAACVLARCAQLALTDAPLPEAERKAVAAAYEARALGHLQAARKAGFAKLDRLRDDPDLATLRPLPAFQALLK